MGELVCKCGCGLCLMDNDFMSKLEKIKDEWYSQSTNRLKITSGYRCHNHNRNVSTKGKAVDILISGSDSKKLYRIAKKHMTGIGISKNFIHMDALTPEEAPRPTVWRYS